MKRSFIISLLIGLLVSVNLDAQIQQEQVQFQSGNWTLKGTLTYPQGGGPYPGFVIIHGSGPSNRDGTVTINTGNLTCLYPELTGDTVRQYKDLAKALTRKGYAVLRYDKRSFTYGTQLDPKAITPYDFVKDAGNAVEFLKGHPKVKDDQLFLIGHSQGANFLPLLAKKHSGIAGLISLAGSSRPIDSVYARQVRDILMKCRQDTALAKQTYQQTLNIFQQVRNGTWDENTPISGTYPQFWKDWIAITDATIQHFQETSVPTLFIYGGNDFNVPAKHGQRFENQIQREPVDFYYLDSMTHLLTTTTEPEVIPALPDTIHFWIQNQNLTTLDKETDPPPELNVRYADNQVIIESPGSKHIADFRLFNNSGKLVMQKSVGDKQLTLSTANFEKGIYFIKARVGEKLYVGRITIP